MDSAKSQLVERLRTANSVLVTVSRSPSVDQLSALIGLSLLINKLDKHAAAVFSGDIPSTIEFLKPEETIEKSPDSLRDFIIALDKNKADKLRYKVEDQLVKIFITPYKTSLGEKDFEFSQGEFNVDLVIALGVARQEDLDQAIISHGRILHDATVAVINTAGQPGLGTVNWLVPAASSLCELVTDLSLNLGDNLLDEQIATALLTGIIAETNRFSNEKTTPQTMSVSARLMSSGANQQLVATNLNAPPKRSISKPSTEADSGTLQIDHAKSDIDLNTLRKDKTGTTNGGPMIHDPLSPSVNDQPSTSRLVTSPPALGGTLTANSNPEPYEPSTDPLSNVSSPPVPTDITSPTPPIPSLTQTPNIPPPIPPPTPVASPTLTPPPPTWKPPMSPSLNSSKPVVTDDETLTDIEKEVNSPHIKAESDINSARDQVESVLAEAGSAPGPVSPSIGQSEQVNGINPPAPASQTPQPNQPAPPVPPPLNYPLDNAGSGLDNNIPL